MQPNSQPLPVPPARWLRLLEQPPKGSVQSRPYMSSSDDGMPKSKNDTNPYPSSVLSNALTPPTTPKTVGNIDTRRASLSIDSANLISNPSTELTNMLSVGLGLGMDPKCVVEHMLEEGQDVGPLACVPELSRPFQDSYELHEQLGYGAWSTVYRASEVPVTGKIQGEHLPMTPPTTPEQRGKSGAKGILAVKKLARRDGKRVLEKEARILTYLHSQHTSSRYLVPFLGFDCSQCSIIMACVPLTLDQYVRMKRETLIETATMFDPVIGVERWSGLAIELISGLAFLQKHSCIHGDVKPSNILLQQEVDAIETETLRPLFCDFSSSQVLEKGPLGGLHEVSAVTTEYAAPELLRALNPRRRSIDEGGPVTTFQSDVFALGVTLLFASTGQSPYSSAKMQIQRSVMAEEGLPLEHARGGDQALRIREGSLVDKILCMAIHREAARRPGASSWEAQTRKLLHKNL